MRCVWCHRVLGQSLSLAEIWRLGPLTSTPVCERCLQSFQRITSDHCPQCGRQQRDQTRCRDCDRWGTNQLNNRAVYQYDASFKAYMQQYKFQGDYALRRVFQEVLTQVLLDCEYDILVPIPVDLATWQNRGFNQVTAWLTDQPYFQALTVKAHHKSQPQSAKSRAERLRTSQPFQLVEKAAPLLAGQRVLLLDDVYTTGRTLRHAAAEIILGGAKAVTSLTLAR